MPYMDKKELNDAAPPELKYSIGQIEAGTADLSVELFRLARRGYLFIGGVKHQEKREPNLGVQMLNMFSMDWENIDILGRPTVAATNLGGIAICAALFGDLNCRDERAQLGAPLVGHGPPFYSFAPAHHSHQEMSPSQKNYAIFATPQLINVAQLMGPALKGYIDVVHADRFTLGYEVQKGMHYGGIYTTYQEVQTIGTIEIDGTDLPPTIKPRSFSSIRLPFDLND